ncbi:SH3 domain-containing protein [Streptomyces paradoxus]|uniref:SH3 domain-containing protein n=1 Tax=Streptomyces paradoxus TaxID=66375 RepID=UPI00362CF8EE
MSLRTRLSIATAAGLLAAAVAVTPAAALDDWDPNGGNGSGGNGNGHHDSSGGNGNGWNGNGGNGNGNGGNGNGGGGDGGNGNGGNGNGGNGNGNGGNGNGNGWNNNGSGGNGNGGNGHHDEHLFKGVVTADRLALRSAPNRGSQIIRYAHRGDVVKIFCKTGGETVRGRGNPLWYLLTDGTWAWGAARYIDNIGPAPRWC